MDTKSFQSGFPADIPDPYARMQRGLNVSPHHRGCRTMDFLARPSMILGAYVHDPKGSRKTQCIQKVGVDFGAPRSTNPPPLSQTAPAETMISEITSVELPEEAVIQLSEKFLGNEFHGVKKKAGNPGVALCDAGVSGEISWGTHYNLITRFSGNQLPPKNC